MGTTYQTFLKMVLQTYHLSMVHHGEFPPFHARRDVPTGYRGDIRELVLMVIGDKPH